jgi:predicted RNA methylase
MEETTMNPNQELWEKGDFTRIATSMRRSGETLVDQIGITDGLEVLDLGCGDGTTAIPAARRGADVLGVDIALQATDKNPIATPADWKPGERVIVSMAVSTEDAKQKFANVEEFKPYLRYADAPK